MSKRRLILKDGKIDSHDKLHELIEEAASILELKDDGTGGYAAVFSPIIDEYYENSVFCSYIKEYELDEKEAVTVSECGSKACVFDDDVKCVESYTEEDLRMKISELTKALEFMVAFKD